MIKTIYTQTQNTQGYRKGYSKALRVKRICSTYSEFEAHIIKTKDKFVKSVYEKPLFENQMEKVEKLDRSVLLTEQNESKTSSYFPLSVTYNRALPKEHWHRLKLDPTLEYPFEQT